MSLRRTLLTAVLASSALLSACSVRPRYKELVQSTDVASVPGQVVVLRVVDTETGQPVPGAKVLAGENRSRLSTLSDEDGLVTLQVTKELLSENPLMEVVLPRGVRSYRLQVMPSGQAPAPEGMPESPAAPESPASPPSPETDAAGSPDAGA